MRKAKWFVILVLSSSAFLLASGVFLLAPGPAAAQHGPREPHPEGLPAPQEVSAEGWQEDLRILAERIPEQHPDPWHRVSEQEFQAAVNELYGQISSLTYPEILTGFMRIVALLGVGDGHSRVRLEPPFISGLYPLRLWSFSDGLYVTSAAPEFAALVGKRVVWLGNAEIDDAIEWLQPVTAGDNAFHRRLRIPAYMLVPEVVAGVGLAEDPGRIEIVVEDALEAQSSAVLTPALFEEGDDHLPNVQYDPLRLGAPADWPTMWLPDGERPLYLRDPENWYWYSYLEGERALYVQFNVVGDKEEGESVDAFFARVLKAAERNDAERLILDLRFNGGGNNFRARPIWHELVGNTRFNRPGGLFVIIGRRTFSAAQNLATILDEHTDAAFVGEPSGGTPNSWGDARAFRLPNSGLRVSISTLYWQDAMPWDTRPWIGPDLAAELSSEDFRAGHDPALAAILALEPGAAPRPVFELMREAFQAEGFEAAVQVYRAYKADPAHRYVNTERVMNEAGYFLLGEGLVAEAIEVFRLNVEAYPDSWNVYDSLGEAFMEAGETELAILNYERSVELNPENTNGLRMLEALRYAPAPEAP